MNAATAAAGEEPRRVATLADRLAHPRITLLILVVALALRVYIAVQGGALYWTDEKRYNASREVVASLAERDFTGTGYFLFSGAEHIGFRWLGLIPAAMEHGWYGAQPPHAKTCALFFGLFGTANLYLVWRIARRNATAPWEPNLALLFAACSNALFFFARHCVPYDASLFCFLVAALIGTGPPSRARSLAVGVCCGCGYLIYNGYWSVAVALLAVELAWLPATKADRCQRGVLGLLGLAAPLAAVFALARLAGYDLVRGSWLFAGTVNQGDFGEGWRFPFEYLWITDGGLAFGLFGFVLGGVIVARRGRLRPPWLRWVAVLAALLMLWILFSDIVPKFVLYGRNVRAAVPFLALAAAGAVVLLWQRWRIREPVALLGFAAGACALAGAANFIAPLRQVFPREFREQAAALGAEVRQRDPEAALQTVYADYLFGPDFIENLPPHRELRRRPHPHHYLPYLYEGYTRAQRPLYVGHDTAMRLIELDRSRGQHLFQRSPGCQSFWPYPGPLSLRLRLPAKPVARTECLLMHGVASSPRDWLLLRQTDDGHAQIGWQHGETAAVFSDPVALEPTSEHTLTLTCGSLYPADFTPEELRKRVLVRVDGDTVLTGRHPFAAATVDALVIGPGISAAAAGYPPFSGVIQSVRQLDPQFAADAEWLNTADSPPRVSGPFFGHYYGPLEISARVPPAASRMSDPLVVTGQSGAADLLSLLRLDDGHVRIVLDHWGAEPLRSAPIAVAPDAIQHFVVSMGSLFPAQDDPRYAASPGARCLREWLYVRLNDTVVFSQPCAFHPAEPDQAWVGRNPLGGTTTAPQFTGGISDCRRRSPDAVGLNERNLLWPQPAPAATAAPLAAIRLKLALSPRWDPGTEPLLVIGDSSTTEIIFVRYRGSTRIQLGHRSAAGAVALSPTLATAPGRIHTIAITRTALSLDGAVALSPPRPIVLPAPGGLNLGVDYFGTKGVRGRFSGRILAVEVSSAAPKP